MLNGVYQAESSLCSSWSTWYSRMDLGFSEGFSGGVGARCGRSPWAGRGHEGAGTKVGGTYLLPLPLSPADPGAGWAPELLLAAVRGARLSWGQRRQRVASSSQPVPPTMSPVSPTGQEQELEGETCAPSLAPCAAAPLRLQREQGRSGSGSPPRPRSAGDSSGRGVCDPLDAPLLVLVSSPFSPPSPPSL